MEVAVPGTLSRKSPKRLNVFERWLSPNAAHRSQTQSSFCSPRRFRMRRRVGSAKARKRSAAFICDR